MTRRVGLYLRISKDTKGDSAGVDRQRADGERLIAQRGWTLTEVYVDNDISAAGRRKRPDYQRMLADLEAGRIDAVVGRSIERLFKTRREQLVFMELGQELRTPVAFTHAPDIDFNTAVGRGIADMQAAWARVEMEQKSERQHSQAQQAAERGLPGSVGQRAFGYTRDGLHLDPTEAPLLQMMYSRWLTGEGMASIAAWLNSLGATTSRGYRWNHNNVRDVLANPRNAGLRGIREVIDQKTGARARWARVVGPAVWPGVVPEQTWRAAMDRIRDPRRPGAHAGRNQLTYLLPGIALCGVGADGSAVARDDPDFVNKVCGRPLVTTGAVRERSLRCPSLSHTARRADLLEDYVTEALLEFLRRADTPTVGDGDASAADLDGVRSESIELRARMDGLARDYADGILDRGQMKAAGDRIRARLSELDRQVALAGQVDVVAPLRAAVDPEPVWEALPMPTRREVLRRVVGVHVLRGFAGRPGGLRFHPETVRLTWYG